LQHDCSPGDYPEAVRANHAPLAYSPKRLAPHYARVARDGRKYGDDGVSVGELDGRPVIVSGGASATVPVWDPAGIDVFAITLGSA
jgi:hypothetical protein